MRQDGFVAEYDPGRNISIASLAYEYPAGFLVPEHAHGADQLMYAIRGAMEVFAGQSVWLIPPHFGLWIPARTSHRLHMPGPVSMRTLYLRRGLAKRRSPRCAVLHVTPLLRELIVEAVRLGRLRARSRAESVLRDLLILNIEAASPMPTFVSLPSEPRALAVAEGLLRDPAQSKSLPAWCADAGVSVRTLERAFRKEVGLDFESWRRQVRLMKAVGLLASGRAIKEVAFAVGYRQSSTFVELFRRTFGATPKAWISMLEERS